MKEILRRLVWDQEGQGMAEYGLILALIAVVLIFAFTNLGDAIKAQLNKVIGGLGGTPAQ
jgi:pilus assembly protein Flp/PilA